MNKQPTPQPELLTPLERELLALVEQWTASLTNSVAEQNSLETRMIKLLAQRVAAQEDSLKAFLDCQKAFNAALIGWAEQPNNGALQTRLSEAAKKMDHLSGGASSR